MPIVTLTLRKPKTPDFKAKVLEAVHAALVQSGVNQNDRFHRVIERLAAQGLDPENVMVVFQDVPWENWSPAGGRMPHG